jgi:signal transduction histidine kinase
MKNINNEEFVDCKEEMEKLKKEKDALEKEVERLSKKLLESETFKSHFISNVTNEIINPFSSVMGLSKSIISMEENDLKKIKEIASLIYAESSFLDFQLLNIFMAAKLESGIIETEISTFDIRELIEGVIKYFEHESEPNNIHVKMVCSSAAEEKASWSFKSDIEKVRTIAVNLLSNAIKFSPKDATIVFELIKNEKSVILDVKDEGKGMTDAEVGIIFDRFERGNRQINSLTPGNGLGLAIVDGLVQMLDGKIKVESQPNKGSEFCVEIPEAVQMENMIDEDGLFFDEDDNQF